MLIEDRLQNIQDQLGRGFSVHSLRDLGRTCSQLSESPSVSVEAFVLASIFYELADILDDRPVTVDEIDRLSTTLLPPIQGVLDVVARGDDPKESRARLARLIAAYHQAVHSDAS